MNEFMKVAIEEAKKGIQDHHGGPFGAVIVKEGKIIGKGHNQVLKNQDPTCHGEIMAIHDACKSLGTFNLKGCDIYTTGYPCPMCMGAILWANIDNIYFGCDTADTETIGFRDKKFYELWNENKNIYQVSHEECLALYQEYMSDRKKENY